MTMTPKEKIENLINNFGAISEMLKVFYDRLIGQGFTSAQALQLTGKMLETTIIVSNQSHGSD